MSRNNVMKFDMDAQLAQIEAFTRQQALAVQDMIKNAHTAQPTVDPDKTLEKVGQKVADLLDSLEKQLEQEMNNINQQLEVLLPTDK